MSSGQVSAGLNVVKNVGEFTRKQSKKASGLISELDLFAPEDTSFTKIIPKGLTITVAPSASGPMLPPRAAPTPLKLDEGEGDDEFVSVGETEEEEEEEAVTQAAAGACVGAGQQAAVGGDANINRGTAAPAALPPSTAAAAPPLPVRTATVFRRADGRLRRDDGGNVGTTAAASTSTVAAAATVIIRSAVPAGPRMRPPSEALVGGVGLPPPTIYAGGMHSGAGGVHSGGGVGGGFDETLYEGVEGRPVEN